MTPYFGILYQENEKSFWWVHVGMISCAIFAVLGLPETEGIYPDSKNQCRKQKGFIGSSKK